MSGPEVEKLGLGVPANNELFVHFKVAAQLMLLASVTSPMIERHIVQG